MSDKTNPENSLASSKCDFKFDFGDLMIKGSRVGQDLEWTSISPAGSVPIQSSKCDWRIQSKTAHAESVVAHSPDHSDIIGRFDDFIGRIGSSKCDFRMSVTDPGCKMRINSDKCDWNIMARTDVAHVQSTIAPGFLETNSKIGSFGAEINSDKCDYRITAKRSSGQVRIDSDKCDWQVALTEADTSARVQIAAERIDLSGIGRGMSGGVASSKCDWRIKLQAEVASISATGTNESSSIKLAGRGFNSKLNSSKCDFRIDSNDSVLGLSAASTPETFEVKSRAQDFVSSVSSSKCDFQIVSANESRLPSNVSSSTIGTDVALASSKCDWKISAIGGAKSLVSRPVFAAKLSSSKCDFVFDISLGLSGSPGANTIVQAVSSAKCDFQITKFTDPGKAADPR